MHVKYWRLAAHGPKQNYTTLSGVYTVVDCEEQ